MAISLSTTLPYGTVWSTKEIAIHSSQHCLLPNQSSKFNHHGLKVRRPLYIGSNLIVAPSPPRGLMSASAVSSSSGSKTSVVSEETTNLLDKVKVFDLNGNGIPISDLWKERKAVVAFARHFGCVLCRTRAAYLAAEKDKMDAAGVALVLIGPGSVDQAKVFSNQTKFKGEVYADPSHSSYEALRFVSGIFTTFTPGAGLKIIQAYMEGYRQDWELSFEKDTRTRGGWYGSKVESLSQVLVKVTSRIPTGTKKQGTIRIYEIS